MSPCRIYNRVNFDTTWRLGQWGSGGKGASNNTLKGIRGKNIQLLLDGVFLLTNKRRGTGGSGLCLLVC